MYYIFEVKIGMAEKYFWPSLLSYFKGNKKEKFGTELPQDLERWIKAMESFMSRPNVANNHSGVRDAKICLDANEWKSKGNTFPNMVEGEEV